MHARSLLAVTIVSFGLVAAVSAEEHEACHNCGRFIKVSDEGFGFRRDARRHICCRDCIEDMFDHGDQDPREFIGDLAFKTSEWNEHRYLFFEDGTFLDMGHFYAAAEGAIEWGPTETWLTGWGIEYFQAFNEFINDKKYKSGHPFGGNEDMLSNTLGVLYGWGVDSGTINDGASVVDLLEAAGHGSILYAGPDKPRDR